MLTRIGIKKKGPHFSRSQEKEENAPLALQNPNAVQVSKAWRNFGFLGGNRLRQREGGRSEEAFPAEINFVPGPPRPLARPLSQSALLNQTLIVKKAPEGARVRQEGKKRMRLVLDRFKYPWN